MLPTSIQLEPGESWSEFVFFARELTPDEEEALANIRHDISQSIFEIQQSNTAAMFNPNSWVEADPSAVRMARQYFNAQFDLQKGEYDADLVLTTDARSASFVTHAKFTLFEYQLEMIRAQVDDYRYGAGIYMHPFSTKQAWARCHQLSQSR